MKFFVKRRVLFVMTETTTHKTTTRPPKDSSRPPRDHPGIASSLGGGGRLECIATTIDHPGGGRENLVTRRQIYLGSELKTSLAGKINEFAFLGDYPPHPQPAQGILPCEFTIRLFFRVPSSRAAICTCRHIMAHDK